MPSYLEQISTRQTPQSEPILGRSDQVENSAGGYVFPVDDWTRLDRFLVMGSENGTYYVGEKKLTKDCAEAAMRCIKADGRRVVDRVVEISDAGRAPSNDPALFVLAMCCAAGDYTTPWITQRQYALDALPKVARIGTHLFHFAAYVKLFRGWGRGLRRAVSSWYEDMDLERLALQAVKYKGRDGWTHRDLLRLSHPKTDSVQRNALFCYMAGHHDIETIAASPHMIALAESGARGELRPRTIREHRVPREVLATEMLDRSDVWQALLDSMPMTAMIRNLGKMTSVGLLKPMSAASQLVVSRLSDGDAIRKARVHPIAVLAALRIYGQGAGFRGSLKWNPVREIVDALDDAFYASFGNVTPTGKRIMIALDVSGSMGWENVNGMPFMDCREASAAMAMIVAKTESRYMTLAFSSGTSMQQLPLSDRQRLDDVVKMVSGLPFGATDCSLPMLAAMQEKIDIDAFYVYTDSETWAGQIHPCQALRQYREKTGIPAKLVVWGMASNGFTIADPRDGGMMDIVGLDAAAPAIVSDWIAGPKA